MRLRDMSRGKVADPNPGERKSVLELCVVVVVTSSTFPTPGGGIDVPRM